MAKIRQQTFAVAATGVGRVDYSTDVQRLVEPIAYNWQESYQDFAILNLLAGETGTVTVNIAPLDTIILYEFYLSCYPASDIYLEIDTGAAIPPYLFGPSVIKTGNQYIDVKLSKGIPIAAMYQALVQNLGMAPIACYYSAHGMRTAMADLGL